MVIVMNLKKKSMGRFIAPSHNNEIRRSFYESILKCFIL